MKSRSVNLIWGIILILAGGLFLAQNAGWIRGFPLTGVEIIFAGLSVLFFASYFLSGIHQWGWLFPALIFGGVTLTIFLGEQGVEGSWVAAPILLGIAVPFIVAFALAPRANWWALIPAWVMLVVTGITVIADQAMGEVIAAFVLFSIALPFVVIFLLDRSRWWALIPAFVLAAVGGIPLLAINTRGEVIAAYVMFAIALPFLAVYLISPKNWWAVIPAGVMASIGLGILLLGLIQPDVFGAALLNGVMFLGWAATFGFLWLRRSEHQTDWAKYPTLGLLGAGVFTVLASSGWDIFWPAALIVAGGLLLILSFRRRRVE
jgi:hypothetical protein